MNKYAKKYREWILKNWTPVCINNLTATDIFEQASVRNCIVQLIKNKSSKNCTVIFSNTSIVDESKTLIFKNKLISKSVMKKEIENWLKIFTIDNTILQLICKIKKSSNLLNYYFDVKQGYIPYRKSTLVKKFWEAEAINIRDNRLWHSNKKINENYKKELQGKDLNRYYLSWSGIYVKYGRWISTYVDLKYFTEKRLLFREITRSLPYSLIASITEEEFVHNPSIIAAIPRETCNIPIEYFLGLSNSKLLSFYFINTAPKATKGLFPKAIVNDIRNLVLSNVSWKLYL